MMGRFCCVGCSPEWEKAGGCDRALDGNATPKGSLRETDKQEETGKAIGCFCCVGYHLKGHKLGNAQGILMGNSCCVGRPPERENDGVVRGGQMGGKVAEIEFFEVGNHAKNGHLSKDKVTKISDKVFIKKKTITKCDNV